MQSMPTTTENPALAPAPSSPSSTDLFHITFDAPGQAQWVEQCMAAVRECLEEFCAEQSPATDVNLWVGRIYGPIKPKRSAKKVNTDYPDQLSR